MSYSKVPFSWENKPGFSKGTKQELPKDTKNHLDDQFLIKLPPPPGPINEKSSRVPLHDIQIPLPPCAFQPPDLTRCSSRRGLMKKEDDPFLVAYEKCIKSKSTKSGRTKVSRHDVGAWGYLRKYVLHNFSCSRSCRVKDGNLVRISHFDS